MTDIISMLAQAQNKAQNENNSRQQNDSVASFFNSISKQPSTNNSTLPIQIKQNIKQTTLESIERNVIPNQDTQNNNASHNDLQTANSPLAMFLNSNNFNTVRTIHETTSSSVLVSASKVQNPAPPQTYNTVLQSSQQQSLPVKNKNKSSNGTANGNAKETTKLITPNMLVQSNNNNTNNNNINTKGDKKQPEPLTKNQMIQALKYLIENDDDFTKKVHEAYLKSLNN